MMKVRVLFRSVSIGLAISGLILASCEKEPDTLISVSGDPATAAGLKAGNGASSYMVVLNDEADLVSVLSGKQEYDERRAAMSGYLNRFLNGHGVGNDQVEQVYTNVFRGFSAKLSAPQLARLQQDPLVAYVEADQEVTLGKPSGGGTTQPAQTVPWGIARVGNAGDGTGKTAWIIDTGIDLTHPDLNVDVARSAYFIGTSPLDENGHGTHVAGTIAAKNNTIGVIGVAAGATVVGVRVLDRRGNGTVSSIVAGCDYVAANGKTGDVANMSLGGGLSTTMDNAVINLAGKGVKVAVAAGNSAIDAELTSPARVDNANVYTVSAMGTGDKWAYFSNYGNPPIDYCAPGVNVLSCYKGGAYATMSGTSMAAPHVAGLLLLGVIKTDGLVIGDPDGKADPIAHR